MKTISKAYQIPLPDVPVDTKRFNFSCDIPAGTFFFLMEYFNDVWNIWVTLPSGEIRQMGAYPNAVSWTGFSDYLIVIVTSLSTIGLNNLTEIYFNLAVLE